MELYLLEQTRRSKKRRLEERKAEGNLPALVLCIIYNCSSNTVFLKYETDYSNVTKLCHMTLLRLYNYIHAIVTLFQQSKKLCAEKLQ